MVGRISYTTRLGSGLASLAFDLCDRIIFSQFPNNFDTLFFVIDYQGKENRIGKISLQKIIMKLCNVKHPILTSIVLQDLNSNLIIFVRDFIGHDPSLLKQKCSSSLTFEEIFQLRAYLIQAFGPTVIQVGDDDTTDEHQDLVLKNDLLELQTNHIYELYGPPGAGKTQFALAMTARISDKGQVFYIDTKNDFSLSRLKSMMMNMTNIHQMLSNVSIAKAFDLHEAMKITEILSKTTITTFVNPKLLILDNIGKMHVLKHLTSLR